MGVLPAAPLVTGGGIVVDSVGLSMAGFQVDGLRRCPQAFSRSIWDLMKASRHSRPGFAASSVQPILIRIPSP